jgi:hypothetical protein
METKEVIFLVLAIVFFIFLVNKSRKKTSFKETKNEIKSNETFSPYKIVENDNTLRSIVQNYETRENNKKIELENRLGKALPNDIIWGILQDLYIESFLKNHKLFLNVLYQQGLLLQKEKKYKDSIAHYSYGLYYLLNFYPHKMNPTNHIIDFVTNDNQVIEMAQYKFINKIKRCMETENIDIQGFREFAKRFIVRSVLPYLTYENFLQDVEIHLMQTKENPIETPLNKILKEMIDDDVIIGFEFNATLQLRTPLEVLKHHKEKVFDTNKELPNYAKDGWEGFWLPITKSFKELGIDIEEPKSSVSSDLGTLGEQEQELYFDFLLKFHTISESAKEVNEKINSIKDLIKLDSNFRKYYNLVSRNDRYFLEDYFGLLIRNVLPPKISGILKEKGYFFLDDLKGVDSKELLKIEGIGKSSINKLSTYL